MTLPYFCCWSLKGVYELECELAVHQGVTILAGPIALVTSGWAVSAVQESLVSEEIVHDLDTCEVTVEGEELNPEQESLEVDTARLQQKGIEVSRSDLGMVFTGERWELGRMWKPLAAWLPPSANVGRASIAAHCPPSGQEGDTQH